MFKSRVGGQDRIVWLHNGVGHCGGRINAKFQLGLFPIVGGKTLEDESTKTRTSSTAERMENEESLKTGAVVREAANLVHDDINLLLANGIMATRICENVL